ncbi:unnamed protein product [Leptidea sinapis]|uniref:Uncharacterized protein n=1 Tax=Leptidea sinapis TaxID=189913 RepID=A0A5E4PXN4_9NEOP|nr:unnamed protein product [Leptidea sinapis]
MEQSKLETPKSPETMHMQIRSMCGDHPFTKTELNVKDSNEEEKEKERSNSSYPHLTPTSSRTERGAGLRARTCSEDAVRALEVRRRAVDVQQRAEHDPLSNNRALLQAALGSFRWPPYLVCVWVLVLLMSHALHCLAGILERSLPSIRRRERLHYDSELQSSLCNACEDWYVRE